MQMQLRITQYRCSCCGGKHDVPPAPSMQDAFKNPEPDTLATELARGRSRISPAPWSPATKAAPPPTSTFADVFKEKKS